MTPKRTPLHLQIQAVIDPEIPVAVVVNALVTAIYGLCGSGVQVQGAQIESRGLGDGYLQTLQDRPDLVAGVVVQALEPTQWTSSSAVACPPEPFNAIEVAQAELHNSYRQRMGELMSGALTSSSQDIHLEWLAAVQQLVERHASVLDFVERQRALCPPQSAQSSAA